MFSVNFGKPKENLKYLIKFSGECLGRQIEFGLSHQEIEHLKAKSRSLVTDLGKWRKRAKSIGDSKGTKQTKNAQGKKPEA